MEEHSITYFSKLLQFFIIFVFVFFLIFISSTVQYNTNSTYDQYVIVWRASATTCNRLMDIKHYITNCLHLFFCAMKRASIIFSFVSLFFGFSGAYSVTQIIQNWYSMLEKNDFVFSDMVWYVVIRYLFTVYYSGNGSADSRCEPKPEDKKS